jgi:hypothetical protein
MNAKQSRQRPRNRLSPVARAAHREARICLDRAQWRLGAMLADYGNPIGAERRARDWSRLIRAAVKLERLLRRHVPPIRTRQMLKRPPLAE